MIGVLNMNDRHLPPGRWRSLFMIGGKIDADLRTSIIPIANELNPCEPVKKRL